MDVLARTIFILKWIIIHKEGNTEERENSICKTIQHLAMHFIYWRMLLYKKKFSHLDATLLNSIQMTPIQHLEMLYNSLIYFCTILEPQRNIL